MVVVTAIGMQSSLGNTVAGCAAARARMNRLSAQGEGIASQVPGEANILRVHRCDTIAGASDHGRLVALALLALEEALAGWSGVTGEEWSVATGLASGFRLVLPVLSERAALSDIEFLDQQFPQGGDRFVLERLLALGGLRSPEAGISTGAHTAVGHALQEVIEDVESGRTSRVLVCTVDSQVEEANLHQLLGQGRLATLDSPNGFFPGEAAVVLVLESEHSVQERGGTILAHLESVELATDPDIDRDEPTHQFHARSLALHQALMGSPEGSLGAAGGIGAVIHDHNGEDSRAAHHWSNLMKLIGDDRALLERPHWVPAESFGDVGAATGGVHICVALRAFARGYAGGKRILICNSSDAGESAVILVRAPADLDMLEVDHAPA